MKTTINKTIKEEVELKLPYFFKTNCHYVALLREDFAIQITEPVAESGIEIKSFSSSEYCLKSFGGCPTVLSTSDEFYEKFEAAKKYFNEL